MSYSCSVCGESVEGDLVVFTDHTEDHIVEEIKKAHPEWSSDSGTCERCVAYYRSQLKGQE